MFQYFLFHPGKRYTLNLAFCTILEGNFCNVPALDSLVSVEANHHKKIKLKIKFIKRVYFTTYATLLRNTSSASIVDANQIPTLTLIHYIRLNGQVQIEIVLCSLNRLNTKYNVYNMNKKQILFITLHKNRMLL